MRVRKAEVKDKEKIVELFMQMQGLHCKNRSDIFKEKTKQETEKEFDETIENKERNIIVVVNSDNKICGVCIFKIKEIKDHPNLKDAKILHIGKIGVDEKYRRKGIGKLMMKEMEKVAEKLNCDRIELNCWSFNEGAIEFYKSQSMKIQRLNFEMKG